MIEKSSHLMLELERRLTFDISLIFNVKEFRTKLFRTQTVFFLHFENSLNSIKVPSISYKKKFNNYCEKKSLMSKDLENLYNYYEITFFSINTCTGLLQKNVITFEVH